MGRAGVDVQFRILGPLEVSIDGEAVDLGPRKQRMLFALLLINHDHTVTTDALLDAIWGDDAPGKENALWVYVSRLRSILAEVSSRQVLVTADRGYRLEIGEADYDAALFEEAYRCGIEAMRRNPRSGSEELSEALAMWRGSALEEFRYDEFAQAEIARLEGLRTASHYARIECDLLAGGGPELIGEIEALADAHPLDEQPVSLLMRAQYRSGRQADALRTFERYRRRVGEEVGTEPSPELRRLEEQILLHDERIAAVPADGESLGTSVGLNPYKGLAPFDEDDSSLFFGRDRLVSEIVRRMDANALVTVIGPSGSGKSSAVRSGVIPAIRKGALEGSDEWLIASMMPGAMPFAELEAALLRSSLDAPDSLVDQLDGSSDSIMRSVLRILPSDRASLVLLIDQFEELFTMCDPGEAASFLDALVTAADDHRQRFRVISTLRADFYADALGHASFARRMSDGIINVVPMAPEELEAAASQPAARAGVRLDPGLEAALIGDVLGEPGALPLFQFALTDLFDRRVGDTLTLTAYREMGGVHGSLSRKAEYLYEGLSDSERDAARQVFLRLVTLSESHTRSRRRVAASELLSLDLEVTDLQAVIEAYGMHRLLTFDRNDVTGSPTVEVAHEALLERWDRLADWISNARLDVQNNAALRALAAEWGDNEQDAKYLLVGGRLDDFREWETNSTLVLSKPERAFLEASVTAVEDREREEAERIAREQAVSRRAKRNAWMLAAVIVAVVAAGGYLLWATSRPVGPSVVMVHDGEADSGIERMILDGARQAANALPIEFSEATITADISEKIERLAADGADVMVMGIDYSPYADQIVDDYPDTHFINMDTTYISAPNVTNTDFADDEGSYLMGVAAAATSKSGTVGYIAASQAPFLTQFHAAYEQGVRATDPDAVILVDYVSPGVVEVPDSLAWFWEGFWRQDMAYDAAMNLFQNGADVVFTVAGEAGQGSVRAAADYSQQTGSHVWAIGVDVDEGFLADDAYSPYVLTSMLKNFDVAAYEATRAYVDGEAEEDMTFNLANDGIGYSDYGNGIRPLIPLMDTVAQEIMEGTIKIAQSDPHAQADVVWRYEPAAVMEVTFDQSGCSLETGGSDIVAGEPVSLMLNGSDETAGGAFGLVLLWGEDAEPIPGLEEGFFLPLAVTEPSVPLDFRVAVPDGPFDSATVLCLPGDVDPLTTEEQPSFTAPVPIVSP
jgi:basic membrane lipoprotein Med (substrate-binding protein (PBP1-ABC) superfamily)/DNA-binding SARP family transcriptional activator